MTGFLGIEKFFKNIFPVDVNKLFVGQVKIFLENKKKNVFRSVKVMLLQTYWTHRLPVSLFKSKTSIFATAMTSIQRPSSNMAAFRDVFKRSKNLLILTGAGVSAESGIPTFRGPGGYWRKYQAQNLATPEAFRANPSLVWEFYHHRRETALTKEPNNVSLHKRFVCLFVCSLVCPFGRSKFK